MYKSYYFIYNKSLKLKSLLKAHLRFICLQELNYHHQHHNQLSSYLELPLLHVLSLF